MDLTITTDELVSVMQAAKELGRPRITIYRWAEKGKIITIRLGGILFVPKSEIERLQNKKAKD